MIFRSLKMAGFKSFAESAEIDIEAGLTGIVGPNGCGKSNVVEALRWVMGESSARQMRGTELDDIIFSGTENRPQRNHAEIALKLDNAERRAPADYNEIDDLEIVRRVERGKGSSYRINGKPVRAKDVQLLFADTATGSRSAGIVSQGRIGAIVGAKPEDRRGLLEEAANIKGLHQRRHEAELRLRNAEQNLERLDDIMAQLADQRQNLQKQARQASRYRSVADRIRKAEATLLLARWKQAQAATAAAEQALREAKLKVAEAAEKASVSTRARFAAAEKLPELRQTETRQAAELQRLQLALSETEREDARITDEIKRLKSQLQQIGSDRQREITLQEDARRSLEALSEEATHLDALQTEQRPKLDDADKALQQAKDASRIADEAAAEAQSKLQAYSQAKAAAESRFTQLSARLNAAEAGLAELQIEQLEADANTAGAEAQKADEALLALDAAYKQAEAARTAAKQASEAAYQDRQDCQNLLSRLTAEADALSYLLAENAEETGIPVSDSMQVADHMEAALAACLAEDLGLPLATGDRGFWLAHFQPGGNLSAPAIGTPLSDYISGEQVIINAIAGVSVVTDPAIADAHQHELRPGQAFVTQDGGLWRWDGLVRKGNASDGERIRQKQRLDALQIECEQVEEQLAIHNRQLDSRQAEESDADAKLKALDTELKQAQQQTVDARRAADKAQLLVESGQTRAADLQQARDNALADLDEVKAHHLGPEDGEMLERQAEQALEAAQEARGRLSVALQDEAGLKQSLETATRRLASIADQQTAWQTRQEKTASRLVEMQTRQSVTETEIERLEQRPDELAEVKQTLLTQVDASAAAQAEAADALAQAESALNKAELQQRNDDQMLGAARESQIRAESAVERYIGDMQALSERIEEKLEATPDRLPEIAEMDPEAEMDSLERLEERVSRLLRERESLGPVNLRADVEMAEIDTRITSMEEEKADLVAAIAKLRAAIAALNREGRSRLLASFADVNKYFSELFTSLFGGGHAELRLTESDDPLQAGLEILASPPGKKMQSLSLLSGGEQALTALAIIFAVFLTNPAPICVLDEVDAPLDDSNVARFCDLLRDIVSRTRTRFLVVTHHRMTMARMDRLFGVTMEQKGISRLVSVDLQTAESFREPSLI